MTGYIGSKQESGSECTEYKSALFERVHVGVNQINGKYTVFDDIRLI